MPKRFWMGCPMSDIRVLPGDGKRPQDVTGELAERIHDLIREYNDRTTLAAAIGVLHIVAMELFQRHEG